MRPDNGKEAVKKILDQADIQIDGHRPWDIRVNNPAFYERILASGSIALGESYMDGWWDCDSLDQFFYKVLSAELYRKIRYSKQVLLEIVKAKVTNLQRKCRAFEIGERHYDIGNDLFATMLDKELFILEDWHSFGPHYDTTLMAWYDNFTKGWEQLSSDYDDRFYRMWTYYLLCSAGSFRARDNQLWQIVFSKKGVPGIYQRIRNHDHRIHR